MGKSRSVGNLASENLIYVDIASDRVGIGTTVPSSILDVYGPISINGSKVIDVSGGGSPNINAGVVTATSFVGNLTGDATGLSGTPNITVGFITATGNISVAGTLTYEDVTNVDSIGLVTARSGAHVATVSGNLLVGTTTPTGTSSQPLQVTGGAYVSGNLGIGITNPTSKLQINTSGTGGIKLVSTSGADTTTSNILNDVANGALYFDTDSTGSWDGYENVLFNVGGTNLLKLTKDNSSNWSVLVGGTSYSFQGLDVSGNIGINGQTIFDTNRRVTRSLLPSANNTYDLGSSSLGWKRGYFLDNVLIGSATSTGTSSQPLQVNGGGYVSGNLGVGVTSPASRIDVYSPTSGSTAIRATVGPSYSTNLYVGAISGLSTDAAGSHRSQFTASGVGATSGELGVYSFYPTFANFPTDVGPRRAVDLVGGFSTGVWGTEYFAINVGKDGSSNDTGTLTNERLRVIGNGNVGIATTTPSEKLHVIGNILASGNVTGYSDETLKDNVQTIPDALDKVTQLRGVEFDRKDIEGNPHQIGVIAQEVEKVIPEVVTTHEDGIKSVAYGNLVGLLIEAIKDLKEEVNDLKARLEEK